MNTNNVLLSICCLGYNHAQFIADNLKAIWDADCKNIEVIAVDDGSKDNSAEILKELQATSPIPMNVILQENTGNVGHNFNVGLKQAKGQFITFMSFDDVLCSDKIKQCITKLSENSNLAFIASSKVCGIDSNGNKINTIPELKLNTMMSTTIDDLLNLEYEEFGAFYIQGTFFRKSIVDTVGGFDEDMTGDDIVLRTKVFNYIKDNPQYTYEIMREPTCYYRRHGDNISNNRTRQIKIVTEYLDRYWHDKESPKILISWVISTINSLNFKDSLKLFSMNMRAASLLNNEKILNKLIEKLKEETSLFRYIYSKKKDGKKRYIRLFYFIKISYTKK